MTTLYREEVALNHLMMRATQRGIMLDLERRDSTVLDKDGKPLGLAPQLRLQRDKALVELQAIGGGAVNPRKPAHIKYLLFDMLGFPIVKVSAKSGKPAVDKEAMMLLELLADTDVKKRALHCIVSHRQAEKFLSTFVDGLPILADQRLHPSWKTLTTSGRMNSSPNCLDAQTEVLTPRGWVKLPDVVDGEVVAQWTANGSAPGRIEFVASNKIEVVHDGDVVELKNQHIDMRMTGDHRCLTEWRTGKFEVSSARDVVSDRKWHNAGVYAGGPGLGLSRDEMTLLVATQADAARGPMTRGELKFGFQKHRKCGRLLEAVRALRLEHVVKEQHDLPDRDYRVWITVRRSELTARVIGLLSGEKKVFGSWVLQMSRQELDWFCEELYHWDGSFTRKNSYSSSDVESAEWVQTALALSGKRAHWRIYTSNKTTKNNYQVDTTQTHFSWTTNTTKTVTYVVGEKFYCVSVPSTFILVRRNGEISVTGNCQNWSKKVKRLFRAPPGFKLVGIDLSQAELRYIAFLANDVELLRMYREEINVHTVNASLLFGVRCPVPKDTNPQTEAYLTEMYPRLTGKDYASLPLLPKGQWKFVRTLGKLFVFAGNYGALAETIHGMLRSKRDPDTNELLFPDLRLDEIEALHVQWTRKLHPALPSWWDMTAFQIERAGRSKCPISGRVRWFRGGFKRNEMLNVRVQTAVASWMNQCTLEIQDVFDRETRGWAQINQQVHDALTVEAPDDYAKRAGEVMQSILSREIHVPGVGTTRLPADKADIGQFMDEV